MSTETQQPTNECTAIGHPRCIGPALAEELSCKLCRASALVKLDVLPPCVVVLGNESNGKSTLLGRLVGLPLFPRGNSLCTRMVIRAELRRGAETMATVEVVDRSNATAPGANKTECRVDELEKTILNMMNDAVNGSGSKEAVLLTHELRVRIQQPDLPTLDLVDVPGLVTCGHEGACQGTPQQTFALAKSVIDRYRDTAMFLVVVDSRCDASGCLVGQLMTRELAQRALGVWTKVDVFKSHEGDDAAALVQKLREKTLGLLFGWCACCTPPCSGSNSIDEEEAKQLDEKRFRTPDNADRIGLPAIRKLVEKYFDVFATRYWLPLVLGKVKDCLSAHAATHASRGLPNAVGAVPARDRALDAMKSETLCNCPLANRIAADMKPADIEQLREQLVEALDVAQGYAGDHTSLGATAISEKLALLKKMAVAPAGRVSLNCAGARLSERRLEAFDALRDFAKFVCATVKGPDGFRAHMLAALDSHPSKWLQRFPEIGGMLAAALDAAVKTAVSEADAEAWTLIDANKAKLVEFHIEQVAGVPTAVIRTVPLLFSLAEEVLGLHLMALHQHSRWETLRDAIPSDPALWVEEGCDASLTNVAEAAELLQYFTEILLRVDPLATTGDDRDLLLATFLHCDGVPASWTRDTPLQEWEGVQVDEAGHATTLDVSLRRMGGAPNLAMLPQFLKKVSVNGNRFCGTPDLTKLPAELLELSLAENEFSGSPNLKKLPHTVKKLCFDVSLNVAKLPQRMSLSTVGGPVSSKSAESAGVVEMLQELAHCCVFFCGFWSLYLCVLLFPFSLVLLRSAARNHLMCTALWSLAFICLDGLQHWCAVNNAPRCSKLMLAVMSLVFLLYVGATIGFLDIVGESFFESLIFWVCAIFCAAVLSKLSKWSFGEKGKCSSALLCFGLVTFLYIFVNSVQLFYPVCSLFVPNYAGIVAVCLTFCSVATFIRAVHQIGENCKSVESVCRYAMRLMNVMKR